MSEHISIKFTFKFQQVSNEHLHCLYIFSCTFVLIISYFLFQDSAEKEKKKKQVVKSVELPIESLTFGFSQVELNQYTEQEFKMIAGMLSQLMMS